MRISFQCCFHHLAAARGAKNSARAHETTRAKREHERTQLNFTRLILDAVCCEVGYSRCAVKSATRGVL